MPWGKEPGFTQLKIKNSAEISVHSLVGVPFTELIAFHFGTFNILSQCLIFAILIASCLGVDVFRLILF